MNHTFFVFVRIASAKNNMGISMQKYTIRWIFCTDQIDIITNFAVITNIVIKRVHCRILACRRSWLFCDKNPTRADSSRTYCKHSRSLIYQRQYTGRPVPRPHGDRIRRSWLVGWLFWVSRPFETVFQSVSGRLQRRGRKRRGKMRE